MMLNSYAKAYNNLSISATSGTLIKSHPKSFMKSYQIHSDFGRELNSIKPSITLGSGYNNFRECVVIQTMVLGEQWLMSEIVWIEDYLEVENNAGH